MLALILVFVATPMPIGSSRFCKWTLLAGMTRRPRATSRRISSGERFSRWATYSISGVMCPSRADSSCVMGHSIGQKLIVSAMLIVAEAPMPSHDRRKR